MRSPLRKRLTACFFFLLLASCAGDRVYQDGIALIDEGKTEAGLAKIEEAARLEPDNRAYRQGYFRQRELAVQRYFSLVDSARQQGRYEVAEEGYRRILAIDPQNTRAQNGLASLQAEKRQHGALAEAEELLKKGRTDAATAKVREVLAENASNKEALRLLRRLEERAMRAASAEPQLAGDVKKPISLEFRDTSLRHVFDLIAKDAGINFIFDRDVKPDLRVTVSVRNSSLEDVLRFILVTNQLERKVLSPNSLLIYPNTAAKQRDYQDLVVKTFYLANSDAKVAANMIKTLVKTKDMHVDEKLNLIVMRDTPQAVRMAERLVANQDLSEPEVMLELEVMEVSRSTLYNIGIQYPSQVSASLVGAAGTSGTVTLTEWLNRNSGLVRLAFSDPFLVLNLRGTDNRANLLANPRIRVKNKDKARVHIGDKVPVITTTTTATGFASQSVTYLDVGLKLEVEPQIYLDDDVGIRVGLEVSSITNQITTASGTVTYQIGTRNANTALRLKDGETQVLAGLINDQDQRAAVQVPGLGDLPILGRLFGSNQDTRNKTEIVLLITPHVVRNLARPELRYEEFYSGTEAVAGAPPLVLQSLSAEETAASPGGRLTSPAEPTGNAVSKVTLIAPPGIRPGEEFMLQVSLETLTALRSGLLDFAFDPSRLAFVRAEPGGLLAAADKEAAFRSSAPEGLGRLNVSFTSKGDLVGKGELARITLKATAATAGSPAVRLEALSLTSSAGQLIRAELPPPVNVSLTP